MENPKTSVMEFNLCGGGPAPIPKNQGSGSQPVSRTKGGVILVSMGRK